MVKIIKGIFIGLIFSIPMFIYISDGDIYSIDANVIMVLSGLIGLGSGLGCSVNSQTENKPLELANFAIAALAGFISIYVVMYSMAAIAYVDLKGGYGPGFIEVFFKMVTEEPTLVFNTLPDLFIASTITSVVTVFIVSGLSKKRFMLKDFNKVKETVKIRGGENVQ